MLKSWNEMRKLDISKYVKKRDSADYLPWADCLKLLYENGAEKVSIIPQTTENDYLCLADIIRVFAESLIIISRNK